MLASQQIIPPLSGTYLRIAARGERPSKAYRRLPSLLCRGFPNPQAYHDLTHTLRPRSADLEIGDTAGLETCGTWAVLEYASFQGAKVSVRIPRNDSRLKLLNRLASPPLEESANNSPSPRGEGRGEGNRRDQMTTNDPTRKFMKKAGRNSNVPVGQPN